MAVTLAALSHADMAHVLTWRRVVQDTLRTPYVLTEVQQDEFYNTVVCRRESRQKYWAICDPMPETIDRRVLRGIGGLVNIEWENRHAEISLLIDPGMTRRGFGSAAVTALLDMGFGRMGLATIWGECYESNIAGLAFWQRQVKRYPGTQTGTLFRRQLLHGELWDSFYFAFTVAESA